MDSVIYIHGKGGNADEAEFLKPLFNEFCVVGFDYKSQTPWEAKDEFPTFFDGVCKKIDHVILVANSIGAYFSMSALPGKKIDKAFFISPIVDMEGLILGMMSSVGITEDELRIKKEIRTPFGETL